MAVVFNPFTGNFDFVSIEDVPVTSVAANDSTLTISPTTGDVLAQINLANFNTWTNRARFREDADTGVEIGTDISSGGNPVGYITTFGTASDIPLVINPKGTGALQINESGDARGVNAIDLQSLSTLSAQVAAGERSFLLSGEDNQISSTSTNSGMVGGNNNTIDSVAATMIAAGASTINSTNAGGGNFIFGGASHNINDDVALSFIIGGSTNSINTVGSGNCIINSQTSSITGGFFQGIFNAFGSSITSTAQVNSILGGSGNGIGGASAASAVVMGFACSVDGNICWIGNGSTNVISGGATTTASTIINGGNNNLSGFGNTIINGFGSTIANNFNVSMNGAINNSRNNEILHSGGNFGSPGDALLGVGGATASTSDAIVTEMQINTLIAGLANITLPQDHTIAFKGCIVARSQGGADHAMWDISALLQDTGGVIAIVGVPVVAQLHGSAGAAAWAVAVAAGAAPNRVSVNVTGALATNIRWNMRYEFSEVEYA